MRDHGRAGERAGQAIRTRPRPDPDLLKKGPRSEPCGIPWPWPVEVVLFR